MNALIETSNTDQWGTPEHFVLKLRDLFNDGYEFDLDPAADELNSKAKEYYDEKDDGLHLNWYGSVFVNPPYGRGGVGNSWARKMREESKRDEVKVIVALVAARVDTLAWHNVHFKHAARILFVKGRIKHEALEGQVVSSAKFPSAVVLYYPFYDGPPSFGTIDWREGT